MWKRWNVSPQMSRVPALLCFLTLLCVSSMQIACGPPPCVSDKECPVTQSCDIVNKVCNSPNQPCREGAKKRCYNGPQGTMNIGACREGAQTCTGGQWGPCEGVLLPKAEVCDNIDNDCDGQVDEDCSKPECKAGESRSCLKVPGSKSLCDRGTQKCQNGKWSGCIGITEATEEVCGNDLDDDCDGQVNEGCPKPECKDGESRACLKVPGSKSLCDRGSQKCQGGKWGGCVGNVEAMEEVCGNDLDDDCDGQVNEGCTASCDKKFLLSKMKLTGVNLPTGAIRNLYVLELARNGTEAFAFKSTPRTSLTNNTKWYVEAVRFDPQKPWRVEIQIAFNQSLLEPISFDLVADIEITETKTQKKWTCPFEHTFVTTPCIDQNEYCNGFDDNCDGNIDENCKAAPCRPGETQACFTGLPRQRGVGACRDGQQACTQLRIWGVCKGAVLPAKELCNDGVDNDCDGSVDEDCTTSKCPNIPLFSLSLQDMYTGAPRTAMILNTPYKFIGVPKVTTKLQGLQISIMQSSKPTDKRVEYLLFGIDGKNSPPLTITGRIELPNNTPAQCDFVRNANQPICGVNDKCAKCTRNEECASVYQCISGFCARAMCQRDTLYVCDHQCIGDGNNQHCGQCYNACPNGKTCQRGSCK